MRKIILTMNEEKRFEVIKKLDTDGNKKNAALKLSCSERHINRMIAGYKREGKSFYVHGNRGRTPAHALSKETKQTVLE